MFLMAVENQNELRLIMSQHKYIINNTKSKDKGGEISLALERSVLCNDRKEIKGGLQFIYMILIE